MEEVTENKSHWKAIFISLIIGLVVIAVIFLIFMNLSGKNNSSSENPIVEKPVEEQSLNSCLKNCNVCEQNCQDNFYFESSQTKADDSLCDKIKNENVKSECRDNFIFVSAIENKDTSLCSQLSDDEKKNSCIYSVILTKAVNTNSVAECEKLPAEQISSCKDNVNFQLATKNNNTSLCSEISSEDLKGECLGNFALG